jgi:uncharacterized protein YbjT (DUF2867 family)
MTVMVTGASGMIGRALVPILVDRDEVRAVVRTASSAEPLRAMGAKVTVGRLDDADALAEVCWGVETLVHLAGGPGMPDDDALLEANHATTLRALEAAEAARIGRFIFVSVPGADPDSSDAFLRAKGLAEEAVAASEMEAAVLRCGHTYGLGSLWFSAVVEAALASPPFVIGAGGATAPVAVDDVARVLAGIDDRASSVSGTWGIEGPEPVEPDALYRSLVGHDAPAAEHPGTQELRSRLSGLLDLPLASSAVRHLRSPARADVPDAAAAFGVARTPLEPGLRGILERAAAAATATLTDRPAADPDASSG